MKSNQKTKRSSKKKEDSETIGERVHRHISDINSKITDEDIKNVRMELEVRGDTDPQEADDTGTNREPGEDSTKKENNKEASRDKSSTSWDVLSEGYD